MDTTGSGQGLLFGPIVPSEHPKVTLNPDENIGRKPTDIITGDGRLLMLVCRLLTWDSNSGEPTRRIVLEVFKVNGEPFDGVLSDTDIFELWECLGRDVCEIHQKGFASCYFPTLSTLACKLFSRLRANQGGVPQDCLQLEKRGSAYNNQHKTRVRSQQEGRLSHRRLSNQTAWFWQDRIYVGRGNYRHHPKYTLQVHWWWNVRLD